ncbi:diguanylate cyclase [Fibrobacter sp. UWEL]|uniref:sensor domain-containing diguanylate cyclase n=1 Tax=Fibrobacter sp. UWEL TaxID=1896209 RepID=UPI00190E6C7E|nr:diguanylate cyclase [Fibrobacter sp. UWEL]
MSKVTSSVVFSIYAENTDREQIELASEIIESEMPDALYLGCSTNGTITEGRLSDSPFVVVCTVCEYPSTQAHLLQYTLTEDSAIDVVENLKKELEKRPWVKAIELLATLRGMSMTPFCEACNDINPDIQIFGGGAFNIDINNDNACVFSKAKGYSEKGVIFLLTGGDDLIVHTTHITGWKPLGREFHVTKANGSILQELDGKPAYDAYYKYLNIPNNEHFFYNTLEFPFFYKHHGINILRAPIASNDDGSLTMTSNIEQDVYARIAYGDPWTILNCIEEGGREIAKFQPEILKVFSCAARRTFWGNDEISKETEPFQSIAPTSGFYTSGEFLRCENELIQHNVTLVIAAMREGAIEETSQFKMSSETFSGKVSMINRLATFIDAATAELAEANQKLAKMAIEDSLTTLYNRAETQRRIISALKQFNEANKKVSLIMMDIDNFKMVNDTYGHKEGDNVILGLTKVIKEVVQKHNPEASCGRWGGEEFMVVLPDVDCEKAAEIANEIRTTFAAIMFPMARRKTISIGVVEALRGESADMVSVRVDSALYEAKNNGKNQVYIG